MIGTLALQGAEAGYEVFLVTGDKDFCQLVTDRIKIYNPFRRNERLEVLDPDGVEARYGVRPEQFIDYLVSPEIEEYLANSRARQIPLHPEAKAPEGLQLPFRDFAVLAVDWEAAATELQEVEEEFQKIFTQ